MKYNFHDIERKWQKEWQRRKVYEPDLKNSKRPFYNLMMFPYPSGEGLHVGNVYAFTGSDIYGRFKRMQGYDVFEPIGLDGFGIHSENYALKIGKHPMEQAKITEKRFYEQLGAIGNGFAWDERLETYDPEYYKWTQWIFTRLFKRGLAYRKKQAVNWCPSCKTVLADEQVISGKCERCGAVVVKKELEQWFFRITKYADKLLRNLGKLDWSERVKIAQRNWIGRSEGAEVDFEVKTTEKLNYLILHGYTGSPQENKYPWIKKELEKRGYEVNIPKLPNTNDPSEQEQVNYVLENFTLDENTVLFGHSLGAIVALKVLQKANTPIAKLVLGAAALDPKFSRDSKRPFWDSFNWNFNYKKINDLVSDKVIISDVREPHRASYLRYLSEKLSARLAEEKSIKKHFTGSTEPAILNNLILSIRVFTTRPDTLFGATYMVLAPEHPLVQSLRPRIKNWHEVQRYIKSAAGRSEEERIAEGRVKTGIELKGIRAVNPATKKEIPVWVADYVLSSYGTGAIMAVPAHDERDFVFAKKYALPIVPVIKPVIIRQPPGAGARGMAAEETVIQSECWVGSGEMTNSGKFDGMDSEKAQWAITKAVGGARNVQYRLRDWLISRQRYWGPPIPMIYCASCAKAGKGEQKGMPGWYAVPEKDLPVKLPFLKDFRPRGKGKSPLASVKSFYEVRCPSCGKKARRETDVSDTFLDSAWYFLRYASVRDRRRAWDPAATRAWLPVNMYIGGAEHSVLHLLYSRFMAMAFHDMKLLRFDEPFTHFRAHGLLISEGAKMSKSKGNVVNPDEYIKKFGADALRMYLMFLAPFEQGGDFRDQGILGITRFLERAWKFGHVVSASPRPKDSGPEVFRLLNQTIKKVGEDIEALRYNTAVSALMILLNKIEADPQHTSLLTWNDFLKLLAPFAPHMSEELWGISGGRGSIHRASWPKHDPKVLREETFTLVVQVNGKMRDAVEASIGIGEKQARELALGRERVRTFLGGRTPKRIVYVPKRLVNIVV
ncbi:MAG: hypothetical protein A3A43_03490 [Candidatus Liptonbacteria bacterium RIFCSPLOWO2_01_FULL_56_20]|uniref:Leucine--tRNA ligase n=1 Tax=Candidatus Liptonbacteria bacterium RIFCSPLOWO2_01_FULL_56_20 TaxID=1798652 RepID=A0A1G2CHR4_9BACT|nr:MAG: Leucine-tRNA ligase [Parcubacteria group bacterium GW2011_GWB1_56_8]OGY97740.1 MAG: hypothetical protein A2681_02080 [Candidatus Liptonbacteria bacterium RIFCSPHIGHO2_01_FULL_56_18b]OGZ00954.1 MAG: hypothetical protein A3A43_03490 [Candidatus Liptonbacteria bacterium RIFCSPLOWO2_01_FULL_56_20]